LYNSSRAAHSATRLFYTVNHVKGVPSRIDLRARAWVRLGRRRSDGSSFRVENVKRGFRPFFSVRFLWRADGRRKNSTCRRNSFVRYYCFCSLENTVCVGRPAFKGDVFPHTLGRQTDVIDESVPSANESLKTKQWRRYCRRCTRLGLAVFLFF